MGKQFMNLLITGGNGQLGRDCFQVFKDRFQTTCVDIEDADITNPEQVDTMVTQTRPDIIVNCAAFTAVDACETQRDAAWAVNAVGPQNLAVSARKNKALLVHISTDYVFNGRKPPTDSYIETHIPSPLSHYGRSKLSGERAVINNTDNFMILRTAWLYGFHGHNFLKTILKKTVNSPETRLKIVNDQFGSPTWSWRLALQIDHLIKNKGQGLYHASSEGSSSWYEFAVYFLEKLNIPANIVPCTTEEYPTPAVRPACSILENRRLKNENLNIMRHWQKDLDDYVRQYGDRLVAECRQ
jgi:dTDP-4-dehydrorhamnose reductase